MSPDHRGWQPFEPGDDPLPPSLSDRDEDGEVVVLAAADGDRLGSWSREAAASVARSWAARTERLLLMDLDLDSPGLHRVLGVENEEGATDIFLFGSSIRRVARAVDGGAFYFAPAGTATADPDTVLRHRRWERLVRGFREAHARLLLYLPLDAPGSDAVLEHADRVVLLGERGALDDDRLTGLRSRIAAALGPPVTERPGPTRGTESSGSVGPEGSAGEGIVDIEDLAPDEGVVDVAELAPDEEVVDVAELAPDRPEERRPADVAGGAGEEAVPAGTAVSGAGVVDVEDLAPDEEVVDVAELAPDRPEERRPAGAAGGAGEEAAPAGTAASGAGVVDVEDLAPDEEVVDVAELAPGAPAGAAAEAVGEAAEEVASDEGPVPGGEAGAREEEAGEIGAEAEEEFGDFDLSSIDELSEGLEHRMDEADEGGTGTGTEAPERVEGEEPSETAPVSGEDAGETGDLGDFPRLAEELPEGEEGPPEQAEAGGAAAEGRIAGPGPDAAAPSAETGAAAPGSGPAGDQFGEDLVTGPDFGDADQGEGPAGVPGDGPDAGPATKDPAQGGPAATAAGAAGRPEVGTAEAAGRNEAAAASRARPRPRRAEPRTGWTSPSRRPVRLALLLLVVAAGALAAHWYGVVRVPGLDRALATVLGPAYTGTAPVLATTEPAPGTPVMEYSLVIDSYRDMASATEVAVALTERLPNYVFAVAPVQLNGEVAHRILVGPAGTSGEAEALREPLASVLSREDPEDWTVRATPLAFLLEESGSLQGASSRASALDAEGVPAYVLQVAYPDEGTRYRVYAGAYATPQEARAMKGIIAQAGIEGALFTERRGRMPE